MTEHKCSCDCNNEKELFDSSTLFFAVLCGCKAQSYNTKHPHNYETRPHLLDSILQTNNDTSTQQTN